MEIKLRVEGVKASCQLPWKIVSYPYSILYKMEKCVLKHEFEKNRELGALYRKIEIPLCTHCWVTILIVREYSVKVVIFLS